MSEPWEQPLVRVSLSLPCQIPVVPGTGNAKAPIEERTERCATDAWWMMGRAFICSEHLRLVLGEEGFDTLVAGMEAEWGHGLAASELQPWAERHRYSQESAQPDWIKSDG